MNIGIVSYWFNRGQATVSRQVRSIYDNAGHNTFVLARPTKSNFTRSQFVSDKDVWKQANVEAASDFHITEREYLSWIERNSIDVVFFDQNYQFDQIARIRSEGVRTIGRFVWEDFGLDHVDQAIEAFDTIYSLTHAERDRYLGFGIDAPYLRWGCFPEVNGFRKNRANMGHNFLYVGGYMSARKPSGVTIKAFSEVKNDKNLLSIKTQREVDKSDFVLATSIEDLVPRRRKLLGEDGPLHDDDRISLINEDMTHDSYIDLFANSDVSLAPSRWEGLGLHLFEALSLGVPTISCDIPPINEVIEHGVSGLLVECTPLGRRPNGLIAYEPTLNGLKSAIEAFADPKLVEDLVAGTSETRAIRDWSNTTRDYLELLNT